MNEYTTRNYDKNNVFAKIIRKEIPATIIYEDDKMLAFKDISPAAKIHILVVPKGEYISYHDFVEKADIHELEHFFKNIKKIIDLLGVEKNGYRLLTNHGSDSNQTVEHFHMHILAGENLRNATIIN